LNHTLPAWLESIRIRQSSPVPMLLVAMPTNAIG